MSPAPPAAPPLLPKLNVKLPDAPCSLLRGNRIGDHVHEPANRIGAVEQCRRTADDFDLAGRRGIGRHRVIARLARQVAHALAVLEHRHAIAVETANDRPRRAGPNSRIATPGDSDSVAPTVASRILRELLSVQHRRRLIRLELRARIRADREHLGEMQIEIDRDVEGRRRRADRDFGAARAVALGAHADVILAGRHVLEAITAVVAGANFASQLVDDTSAPDNGCLFSDCVITPLSLYRFVQVRLSGTTIVNRIVERQAEGSTRIVLISMHVGLAMHGHSPQLTGTAINLRWKLLSRSGERGCARGKRDDLWNELSCDAPKRGADPMN